MGLEPERDREKQRERESRRHKNPTLCDAELQTVASEQIDQQQKKKRGSQKTIFGRSTNIGRCFRCSSPTFRCWGSLLRGSHTASTALARQNRSPFPGEEGTQRARNAALFSLNSAKCRRKIQNRPTVAALPSYIR